MWTAFGISFPSVLPGRSWQHDPGEDWRVQPNNDLNVRMSQGEVKEKTRGWAGRSTHVVQGAEAGIFNIAASESREERLISGIVTEQGWKVGKGIWKQKVNNGASPRSSIG